MKLYTIYIEDSSTPNFMARQIVSDLTTGLEHRGCKVFQCDLVDV